MIQTSHVLWKNKNNLIPLCDFLISPRLQITLFCIDRYQLKSIVLSESSLKLQSVFGILFILLLSFLQKSHQAVKIKITNYWNSTCGLFASVNDFITVDQISFVYFLLSEDYLAKTEKRSKDH